MPCKIRKESSNSGTTDPTEPKVPAGAIPIELTKPSEFADKWQEYLDSFEDQDALDAFLDKEEITIALKTSNMKVSAQVREDDGVTEKTPADSIMNLNGVTNKIVNLIFLSEYKAETTLNLVNEDNGTLWDITLPATTKPINLQLQFPKATVLTKSAGNTEIDLLTVVASDAQSGGDGVHSSKVAGLILGKGISVEGINQIEGATYVDGATVAARAIFPKAICRLDNSVIKTLNASSNVAYSPTNANGYKKEDIMTAGGGDFYIKNFKVYKGDKIPTVSLSGNSNPFEQLIIAKNATAEINICNVNEIVGETKATECKVYFPFNNKINHKNLEAIKDVTIGFWHQRVDVYPTVEDCIVEANQVYAYPSSTISNTEFKYTYNGIYVVPSVQTEENPSYAYTFDGCTFPNYSTVTWSRFIDGEVPLLDGEGKEVTKTRWEWFWLDDNGDWNFEWAYEDRVPAEAKKLDPEGEGKYWRKVEETVYVQNTEKVEDYDVIIGLNGCKISTQDPNDPKKTKVTGLTKDSNVFDLYEGSYDVNLKYDINGTVFTPRWGKVDENLGNNENTNGGRGVILVKD